MDAPFIEDVTHLFIDDDTSLKVSDVITEWGNKDDTEIKEKDFKYVFHLLCKCNSFCEKLLNQNLALCEDLSRHSRLNHELHTLTRTLGGMVTMKDGDRKRLEQITKQFHIDEETNFLSFVLHGAPFQITCKQMRQIVGWYPKGYVYFEKICH